MTARTGPRTGDGRTAVGDVKRALRALADGTAPTGSTYRRVIDRAAAAADDVRTAARFVEKDGTTRLRRAVAAAERRNDRSAARKGRSVLDSIERYRRAASGTTSPVETDYIHSGRGTVLSGDSKSTDT